MITAANINYFTVLGGISAAVRLVFFGTACQ
jgi:hypothetical protein